MTPQKQDLVIFMTKLYNIDETTSYEHTSIWLSGQFCTSSAMAAVARSVMSFQGPASIRATDASD